MENEQSEQSKKPIPTWKIVGIGFACITLLSLAAYGLSIIKSPNPFIKLPGYDNNMKLYNHQNPDSTPVEFTNYAITVITNYLNSMIGMSKYFKDNVNVLQKHTVDLYTIMTAKDENTVINTCYSLIKKYGPQ